MSKHTDMETPTDAPPTEGKRGKIPARGRRRVLSKDGDYLVYQIAEAGTDLPKGSLLPIPEVPRFKSTADAIRWIKQNSGDRMTGKQLMIFRVTDILRVKAIARTTVEIETKPKIVVHDPQAEAGPSED